jgi:hypothetical protein
VLDEDGKPVLTAKYTAFTRSGLLRLLVHHRRQDRGLETAAEDGPGRLGHSSITMTMDVYGHLFSPAPTITRDGGGRSAASQVSKRDINATCRPKCRDRNLRIRLSA